MLLRIIAVVFLLVLSACSSTPAQQQLTAQRELYCDRYLIYRMCAQDISGDGEVDAIYFEDSEEVFLYKAESEMLTLSHFNFHECAQLMDEQLIQVSNQLLTIDDETSFFKRTEVKSGLIKHYLRYIPQVRRCNKEKNIAQQETEEEFDNFAYDDYDY